MDQTPFSGDFPLPTAVALIGIPYAKFMFRIVNNFLKYRNSNSELNISTMFLPFQHILSGSDHKH